jgi:hypothetical protein
MEYITFKTKHPAGECIVYDYIFYELKQTNLNAGNVVFDEEGNLYIPNTLKPINVSCNSEAEPFVWNTSIHNILEDKKSELKISEETK